MRESVCPRGVPLQGALAAHAESSVGVQGALEGVKLEEQVLILERGVQQLTTFPYEGALLALRG